MPPVLLVAVSLAAGELLGLWLSGGPSAVGEPPGSTGRWTTAALGLLCAGSAAVGLAAAASPLGRRGAGVLFAGLAGLAGFAMGAQSGRAVARSCVVSLRSGEAVAARGTLLDPVPARSGPDARSRSVRLRDVVLSAGGGRCRLPALRARVTPGGEAGAAGRVVGLRGVWRSYPRGGPLPSPIANHGALVGALVAVGGPGRGIPALAAAVRARAGGKLAAVVPGEVQGTARALTLADRSTLDLDVRSRFVDAGIVHLLAISGLHIGLFAGAVVWLAGLFISQRARYKAAAAVTLCYVAIIGAPASAVRAGLLFTGYAASRLRGSPAHLGDLAGLAALIALLDDPLTLVDPSFQLSFAGFFGVVMGGRAGRKAGDRLRRRAGRRLPRAATAAIMSASVSTGAFVCTAPIAAAHFGRLVPAAIASSPPATALVALALPPLALAILLPGALAAWCGASAAVVLRALHAVAAGFAALPMRWSVPAVGGAGWAALGLLAVAAGLAARRRTVAATLLAGTAAGGFLVAPVWLALEGRGQALVCSLDVGQGDATAVRTRAGRWILIDAGPGLGFLPEGASAAGRGPPPQSRYGDAGRSAVVPFLRSRGAREIELFVLSHPHLDHFGGSEAVFDAFRVRRVLDPGFAEPSAAYLAFLDRVGAERSSWIPARAGLRLAIDDARLLLLWPPEEAIEGGANEHSLSFRLRVPGLTYLNTGDAPAEVERAILARWDRDTVSADLLKLGHHGSRTSSTVEWLRAVRPAIAVVSSGVRNTHGHPHAITLARTDSARVGRVWRTDADGTLCLQTEPGGRWKVVAP